MRQIIFILFLLSTFLSAQQNNLYIPVNIRKAYQNNTRSFDGNPGPNYWQNHAKYTIEVELDPGSGFLTGNEQIVYHNNSPDDLRELYIHVFMNVYKKGNPREFEIDDTDAGEGVTIDEIRIDGKKVYDTDIIYIHNDFILNLQEPLKSSHKTILDINWHYTINKNSHFRTGLVDSTTYFVAYFFPRVAVYDDIDGWNDFKYAGSAEFYNDFADFDVKIIVPRNFVVWATGMLQNPESVLNKKYAKRYKSALSSDQIIRIIDSNECKSRKVTRQDEKNSWHFKAENVTDFAFAISDHYMWDASSLVVDEQSERRVLIDAAYNKNSQDFYQVAQIACESIKYMSEEIPGIPFPYPNETVFNGLDAMEYPMMVNNHSTDDPVYLVKVTSHEIFHTYFPFYMGTNESKYAWMDEGFACFGDYLIVSELVHPDSADFYYLETYRENTGTEVDVPIIINSKHLKRPMYHINAYAKSASFLYILKDLLGKEMFVKSLKEYIARWNGKHPTPYDFFFTLNRVTAQDLNWLIQPWFFDFGYVDLAINNVISEKEKTRIVIEKKGHYPAPVHLMINYANGETDIIKRKSSVWKDGQRFCELQLETSKDIRKIEILNRLIPDVDISNNVFIMN